MHTEPFCITHGPVKLFKGFNLVLLVLSCRIHIMRLQGCPLSLHRLILQTCSHCSVNSFQINGPIF